MSTNTVVTVPSWAQASVAAYAENAYNLWTVNPVVAYSGSTAASQTQNEADGIAALATRGRNGELVISKAITFLRSAINGEYLPGTKAEFVAALALVTGNSTTDFASVNSRIGKKARYVGDPDSAFLAQTLATGYPALFNARMSAAIYANNYEKEREFRDHAMAYGVEMGKHSALDAELLRKAGLAIRDYLQTTYVIAHKLFVEQQNLAVSNLEIFGNAIRALTGSQQTTISDDPQGNKVAAAVGMGMVAGYAGYYIGAYIGGTAYGPVGAAIGFVVGGIVGYLTA